MKGERVNGSRRIEGYKPTNADHVKSILALTDRILDQIIGLQGDIEILLGIAEELSE
jgi:hypothetical protein